MTELEMFLDSMCRILAPEGGDIVFGESEWLTISQSTEPEEFLT